MIFEGKGVQKNILVLFVLSFISTSISFSGSLVLQTKSVPQVLSLWRSSHTRSAFLKKIEIEDVLVHKCKGRNGHYGLMSVPSEITIVRPHKRSIKSVENKKKKNIINNNNIIINNDNNKIIIKV